MVVWPSKGVKFRFGLTGCGKSNLFCHSERSEESLFDLNAGKERFLGAQRASE
jgi:hypothetical protein